MQLRPKSDVLISEETLFQEVLIRGGFTVYLDVVASLEGGELEVCCGAVWKVDE